MGFLIHGCGKLLKKAPKLALCASNIGDLPQQPQTFFNEPHDLGESNNGGHNIENVEDDDEEVRF